MAPAPLWDGDADFSAADPPEDVLVTELDGEVVGYARRHLAPLRLALVRRSQGGTPIPTGRAGPRDAAGSRARDCTP